MHSKAVISQIIRRISFWALLLCVLFGGAQNAPAGPFEDTVRILENSTSFHWGRDCLVWIVHYPEALVDPWADSEAGRTGMTESERTAYKESFVKDLSIGKLEPFLFTVYAFGIRPLSFAPFAEKIALVTSGGERLKPVRYDRVLDQPINGIAQGLVFFPKQKDGGFALSVRGMGVYDERIFAFSDSISPSDGLVVDEPEYDGEIVVVDLPSAPPKREPATQKPKTAPVKPPPPKTIERPQPPAPPKEPDIVVIEPDSSETESMADFVAAMREGRTIIPAEESENNAAAAVSDDPENAYISRETTLRNFLDLWMQHNPEKMYSMLADSSQRILSRQTFEAELRKASDFRAALKDGYKIDWLGTERAKIVAVKRVLLIRSLVSRTLGVTRENSIWKIVW